MNAARVRLVKLVTKPDLERVRERWDHFWNNQVLDRPLVCAEVPKDDAVPIPDIWSRRYWNALHGDYNAQLDLLDEWGEKTLFMGELVPHFSPDHGPDQFAAWLGSELRFNPDNPKTNWAVPTLRDWETFLPAALGEENPTWQSVLRYSRLLAQRGQGKYLVGMADLHSHLDAFSALRHPDQLCMDLYDIPHLVRQGAEQVRAIYPRIYEALYQAGGMSPQTGTVGWLPLWCEGRTAAVQCDFAVFPSNEMFRQFILEGIRQETEYLDHCFYHLDGKQQLKNLDDLLALPKLDGIQWVPGAGERVMYDTCWRDVLKKILQAGKKVIVYGKMSLEAVQDVHRDLGPRGVVYLISGGTRTSIQQTIDWLEKNS